MSFEKNYMADHWAARAAELSLDPGCVLKLASQFDNDPWFYLLLELDFENNKATMLCIGGLPNDVGKTSYDTIEILLNDVTAPLSPSIRWMKL